jgi:hypothetical protein
LFRVVLWRKERSLEASLLSPEQSPEQLQISLRICKTAKTLIRKTRYLLHPNSVFSKLGLFEKQRKSTKTLCRETPRIANRENTKCEEVRNLPKCRTGKISQLENAIEDPFGFCF